MLSCRKIRRRRRERGTPLLQFYASRYRLPGDPSGTRDCLFFPPRPVASLSLCLWIELLSAEPLPELLSMPWCGEAVDGMVERASGRTVEGGVSRQTKL
jgi:hypothetical protein